MSLDLDVTTMNYTFWYCILLQVDQVSRCLYQVGNRRTAVVFTAKLSAFEIRAFGPEI